MVRPALPSGTQGSSPRSLPSPLKETPRLTDGPTDCPNCSQVSFSCESCCEILKKPKLDAHAQRCRGAQFTCPFRSPSPSLLCQV